MKKYYLMIAMACVWQYMAYSQTDSTIKKSPFTISHIIINGNKKTKPYIILRELPFKEKDSVSLPELVSKFEIARRQLYNTRLFNDVIVAIKGFNGYAVEIEIEVKERWYIFPVPYFKPADRNLSAWADKGYNLNRVNYGIKLSYYNFSGRNDKLKLWLVTGYSRQFRLSYEQPYADKLLRHGFITGLYYAKFKEANAYTLDNKQFFLNADTVPFAGKYLNEQMNAYVGYTYRPAIKTRHLIRLGFSFNKMDSVITALNPAYFNNNKRSVYYPELSYIINYNNSDYIGYPLKGFVGEAGITKKGINRDMNLWELYAKGNLGWKIANKTFYGVYGFFLTRLPFDQPFYNTKLLGYDDLYLRGLEKYVIDGMAAGMVRNTIRRKILNFDVATPYLHSRSHDRIPFRVYVKAYGDIGYVYDRNFRDNSLVNKMLYTAGVGLDVVTLYDAVFRFEYSFNQLGQNGLFLHFKNEF